MRKIKVKKLTKKEFSKYGEYENLLKTMNNKKKDNIFIPDCVNLTLGNTLPASISVAKVSETKRIIKAVEYHKFTCEGILPLDGDCIIFVAPGSFDVELETIEAFMVPNGTFVKLKPGVLHGRQFTVNNSNVNVMILLPQRTYANDMIIKKLKEEEKIEIVL